MTRNQMLQILFAGAAALALGACSGTGAGLASIAPSGPSPTPAPTPTPTPTPAPPLAPEHIGLVSSVPFAVVGTGDTFTTDVQGQQPTVQSQPSANDVQLSYDP